MIFGSTYAGNYYFYYCRPTLLYIYISFAFISNFAGFLATMSDKLH